MVRPNTTPNMWLNRFARLLAASTFALVFIGGLVTSTGSGLSVPDWPSTYGHFMFSFPLEKMVGGIFYEHGHRMVASVVGMLTVILTIWVWLKESRRWLRWLASAALLAVIAQGILGGITVLYQLPTSISVLHGCLAQTFFMMTVAMALFTSPSWCNDRVEESGRSDVFSWAFYTTVAVYVQLVLGAIMRHTGSGLAIGDFPLAFGKLIPPITSQAVAIHFLHRVGAVGVTLFVTVTVWKVIAHHRQEGELLRPALVLVSALILQITLAAFTIWTRKAVLPTTAHVATGAFILATSLVLALRSYRYRITDETRTIKRELIEHASPS